jgi:4-hydroxy-2-oxoheptanedioate aldolase
MFPSPSASRTIARVPGVSWVLIDQEHGNVSDSAMHECIANVAPYGVSPLVRIPDSQRWMIKRALDAGAHGIMVPLLSTVEEVEEVVKQVLRHSYAQSYLFSLNFRPMANGALAVPSRSMPST